MRTTRRWPCMPKGKSGRKVCRSSKVRFADNPGVADSSDPLGTATQSGWIASTSTRKLLRSQGTFHRSCHIIRIAQYSGSFSDSCRVWLVDIFASCARGHVLAYGLGTLGQTSPRSYSDGSNFFSPTGSSGHRDWSSGNSRRDWRDAVESGAFRRVGINVHATGSLPSKRPCIATTTDDCRSAGGGPASSITPANRVLGGDNRSFCCW